MSSAIDQRVATVLSHINVVTALEAAALRDAGALFVDTRPREQREQMIEDWNARGDIRRSIS